MPYTIHPGYPGWIFYILIIPSGVQKNPRMAVRGLIQKIFMM